METVDNINLQAQINACKDVRYGRQEEILGRLQSFDVPNVNFDNSLSRDFLCSHLRIHPMNISNNKYGILVY